MLKQFLNLKLSKLSPANTADEVNSIAYASFWATFTREMNENPAETGKEKED
jgi:hypothetical protein